MKPDAIDPVRRGFLFAGATAVAGTALAPLAAGPAAAAAQGGPPGPVAPADDATTADILVETLIAWGVTHVYGMVGDGIAGVVEALRKRQDRLRFVGVRHEEAAAFMASAQAKLTGRLAACIGTTGPGAVHLLNGLYDAAYDGAPVVAITGVTFHDLIGTRFIQALDTKALMEDVADYNVLVTGPRHARLVGNRACRAALARRGVAHLAVPKDVQAMKWSADRASMENHDAQTSAVWQPITAAPDRTQLQAAADALNAGGRVAMLVGPGAAAARAEVEAVADRLGAPVAKALLGRTVLPDDSPFTTGGIGHLGTAPSSWAMHTCDTVLVVGSTMPWLDFYPRPGQARGVQVDVDPERIGLRYPVEIGLVGDARATLAALVPLLRRKAHRSFLAEAQQRMRDWNALLARIESSPASPLRPQAVVRAVSDRLADDAIVTFDCGANTHFAARHLRLSERQRLVSPGMLDTMAPGLPYAIAARLTYPTRQVVAIAGDGGFAMLMAELTTAVQHQLPIKVVVLDNQGLAQVVFEQKEAGYGTFGTALSPIDFVAFARACGADGVACRTRDELGPAIDRAFAMQGPAIVHAFVDPAEEPRKPEALRG